MSPRQIEDFMGKRVEMCIAFGPTTIDITWLPSTLPIEGESFYDIPQDFLEIHIASLYLFGKILHGDIPNREHILKNYLPFYGENLRSKRMEILKKAIQAEALFLQKQIDNKNYDIFCYLAKFRKLFLQWFFISKRKYLVSYEKNIMKQLEQFSLSPVVRDTILCVEGADIFQISQNLLNLASSLIDEK
jgi:hypothetical protein